MRCSVSAFIIARNEEDYIGDTIDSLMNQTHKLDLVVVVDDGSTDFTSDIAMEKGCCVISLPPHEESHIGKLELTHVRNAGLAYINNHGIPDFVLQMGADHILPDNYVASILSRMGDDVRIASGGTQHERIQDDTPWGSGRLIDAKLWHNINGMQYPVKYGAESWIIYKVKQLGFKVKRYDDVMSFTRPVRMNPFKAFIWGKATYALGGCLPFALWKASKNGWFGINMMIGYFSRKNVEKFEDVAKFVRKQQYEKLFNRVKHLLLRRDV